VTQIFGGREDTNAILADDKLASSTDILGYPPTQCHPYCPIGLVLDTQCQLKYRILSVYRLKTANITKDFTQFEPNASRWQSWRRVDIGTRCQL
jgi:hypothetical protein